MNCSSCGAAVDANYLTCQFCGAANITLDAEQELHAIRELAESAKRIGAEDEGFIKSMMAQTGATEGSSKNERIAQLWTNAFLPLTFEAQNQALAQVNSAVVTTGRSDHAAKHIANEALVQRGEVLAATMLATAAGDPGLVARATTANVQFQQTRARAEKFKKAAHKKAYLMIAFAVGFFILLFGGVISILVFGDTEHLDMKCRGEYSSCDDACRVSSCVQLCDEGTRWACMALARLDGSPKRTEPPGKGYGLPTK